MRHKPMPDSSVLVSYFSSAALYADAVCLGHIGQWVLGILWGIINVFLCVYLPLAQSGRVSAVLHTMNTSNA